MFGGNWMSPLVITLIVIVVLVVVTAVLTYFVRNKYYSQIDDLDKQKNEVLDQAPYDELKEVSEMNITGQSLEVRKKLEKDWHEIEAVKYPQLENYLFDAEQATDRYRLTESKRHQEAAEEMITEIKNDMAKLQGSLKELIEREQANLEKIDDIKKRYHEVRKSLLAYSFSFGPASESFEHKLRLMEDDFTEFSEYTVSGDHEEAKAVVQILSKDIQETEEQMQKVPPILDLVDETYAEDLDDLENGYEEMIASGYLFPNDTIEEDIQALEEEREQIYESIRVLELEQAKKEADELAMKIDKLYQRMEVEIEAKPKVLALLEDTKKAIYYLADEYRRLDMNVNRISQSYVLNHNEEETVDELDEQVKEAREDYEVMEERIKQPTVPFSVAYKQLQDLFNRLEYYNNEYNNTLEHLENYRAEELELQDGLQAMEEEMYSIKRRLENERLPGLPDTYLELFFSTTDRIEQLAAEISRSKIQLVDIRRLHEICVEDVSQLKELTEEVIRQVELTERVSQRLYRYKDENKGVLETIRYSESLFNDNYDYDTALRLVREKLENVAPGVYEEIVQKYENENQNQKEN